MTGKIHGLLDVYMKIVIKISNLPKPLPHNDFKPFDAYGRINGPIKA